MVDEDSRKKMLNNVIENKKELEKTTAIRKNIPQTRLQKMGVCVFVKCIP